MKYEEWIKYEEERLRMQATQKSRPAIKVNGRELGSLTLEEILALMHAWVAAQPQNNQAVAEPPAGQPLAANSARAI